MQACLMSGWHDSTSGASIPFPLSTMPRFWFDHDEYGFNLGAVVVPPHWARLLATTGAVPLRRSAWATAKDESLVISCSAFRSNNDKSPSSESLGVASPHSGPAPPASIGTPPPEVLIARHPRFYGKILSMVGNDGERQIVLEDINGMSGGPIFGLRLKGGDLDDRLIAVQGSWGAQSRVVAASLIRPLMTAIARRFTQMIAEQAAAQDAAMRTKSTRSATQRPATHTRN